MPAIDWAGHYVPDGSQYYTPWVQIVNGVRTEGPRVLNPDYKPPPGSYGNPSQAPAPVPPQFLFTFDTIGQTIFRSIGDCRLPVRPIWAQGINESGDTTISNTQTFAGAVCWPIDPNEEGGIQSWWAGGSLIFADGSPVTPSGWSAADAALLATSIANITSFPGDEAQLPADLIVADKGADKTNAFRNLRYFIFPNYPINGGSGGGGLPQLSAGFVRSNDGETDNSLAVEFASGSG